MPRRSTSRRDPRKGRSAPPGNRIIFEKGEWSATLHEYRTVCPLAFVSGRRHIAEETSGKALGHHTLGREGLVTASSSGAQKDPPNRCPACGSELIPGPDGAATCPRCGPSPPFSWEFADGTAVVRLRRGEIDAEVVNQLDDLLKSLGGRPMSLDFGNATYLSSATLAELVRLKKRVRAAGGELTLRGIHPSLRELFEITRLDRVFPIEWGS
jgi:anti-sigma B factor antagonist